MLSTYAYTAIVGCRPNVCGSRHNRHCCSGWSRAPGSSRCLVRTCHILCLSVLCTQTMKLWLYVACQN